MCHTVHANAFTYVRTAANSKTVVEMRCMVMTILQTKL